MRPWLPVPHLGSVLEGVLYVGDLERACTGFYEEVLGLAGIYADQRLEVPMSVGDARGSAGCFAAANPARP